MSAGPSDQAERKLKSRRRRSLVMSIVDIILGLLIAAGGASNPLFYAIGGFLIGIGFIVLYASLLQRRYRFCVNCAARLSKDVAFCAKCGAKQPAAHTTAATAPASQ